MVSCSGFRCAKASGLTDYAFVNSVGSPALWLFERRLPACLPALPGPPSRFARLGKVKLLREGPASAGLPAARGTCPAAARIQCCRPLLKPAQHMPCLVMVPLLLLAMHLAEALWTLTALGMPARCCCSRRPDCRSWQKRSGHWQRRIGCWVPLSRRWNRSSDQRSGGRMRQRPGLRRRPWRRGGSRQLQQRQTRSGSWGWRSTGTGRTTTGSCWSK